MSASPVGKVRPPPDAVASPASGRELLVLRNVVKSWRAGDPGAPTVTEVLRGATLRVETGETVAIVAAPRAGSSTLLLVAAGLARPDRGAVSCGSPGRGCAAPRIVPTAPALPTSATPREVLLECACQAGFGEAIVRVVEKQLRQRALSGVADVPLRSLPAYVAWCTALAAARMVPGVLLVDRPPDDALRPWVAVDPTLAVAERMDVAPRAEVHVVRGPEGAPPGARVLALRGGRIIDRLIGR